MFPINTWIFDLDSSCSTLVELPRWSTSLVSVMSHIKFYLFAVASAVSAIMQFHSVCKAAATKCIAGERLIIKEHVLEGAVAV
jgi:hypothetical protein